MGEDTAHADGAAVEVHGGHHAEDGGERGQRGQQPAGRVRTYRGPEQADPDGQVPRGALVSEVGGTGTGVHSVCHVEPQELRETEAGLRQ